MTLQPGTRLGHYEILGLIGVGGMGEVYRAHDHKLKRDVALKVLPEQFARDPDRVARFRREAQLLASLNHNNIAAIYGLEGGVEGSGEPHYLVMELVEGDTLRDLLDPSRPERQSKGEGAGLWKPSATGAVPQDGLPIDEALRIASQIAEALEHAHEKTVIHRDLKPANVKVTPQGKVKVLDFGLAKAFAPDDSDAISSTAPTALSASPTIPGAILGTPAYMSPEQAKGKTVDRRTDIWALGCVLYELLTGQGAFHRFPSRARGSHDERFPRRGPFLDPSRPSGPDGPSGPRGDLSPRQAGVDREEAEPDTVQDIIARVLQAEPDWSLLPADTPPAIRSLLRRCLQKDAAKRSRDAAEIHLQIEEARAASSPAAPTVVAQAPAPAGRGRWLLYSALTGVAIAVLTGVAVWTLRPAPAIAPRPVERFVVPLPPDERLSGTALDILALSPDSAHLAYVATSPGGGQQIYLRAMDALESQPIAGTGGGASPFFSPDGQWLGFFAGGKLKKVSVSGGATLTLCDAPAPRGAAWGPNDTIVFAPGATVGLSQVSAAGGAPQPLTKLSAGESSHRWPQFLPDGKTVLFTIGTAGTYDDAQIAVQRLDSSEHKVLVRGGTYGRYVPTGPSAGLRTGHLVYYRAGTLMAVSFDLARLEVQGTPAPVLEGVRSSTGNNGAGEFSFSSLGSLVYVPGGPQGLERTLVWVDRKGVAQPLPATPRAYRGPRISPDGRLVAVAIAVPKSDVWIYDLTRDTLTRLTFEENNDTPLWAPDGKRVVYESGRAGPFNLFWKLADGSGPEERLTTSEYVQQVGSFSPDGRNFVYAESRPTTNRDIWVLPMEGDRKPPFDKLRTAPDARQAVPSEAVGPRVFLQTPFNESSPRLSPDGRWLAYISDDSGRYEVYVRPFPGPGGKWQISTEGGNEVTWSPKGGELFYRAGTRMMAVDITTQPGFAAGKPRLLFEGPYDGSPGAGLFYSVSPDGQRFLMMKPTEQQGQAAPLTQINVVLNWFEELKRRVPVP